MLVSQNADLLDITIPRLLGQVDWCLIVMDNESKEVEEKIYEYQKKYYNRMFVRRSSIPSNLVYRQGVRNYHWRWKSCKGVIRDDVFINLRKILDQGKAGYDKIDILLWPDSDVIFTDYLPELLDNFMASDCKAIAMKHVDVVGDMVTIKQSNIGHHVHIMKYSRELAGLPWRFYAMYYPLTRADLMRVDYYSVHLAYFNSGIRNWRNENWKSNEIRDGDLRKLDKSVEKLSPEEITNFLKV